MASKAKKIGRRSLYGDGSYQKELPVVRNIGELKALIATLPDLLPLNGQTGLKPRWFNVGRDEGGSNGEHMDFDDSDLSDW